MDDFEKQLQYEIKYLTVRKLDSHVDQIYNSVQLIRTMTHLRDYKEFVARQEIELIGNRTLVQAYSEQFRDGFVKGRESGMHQKEIELSKTRSTFEHKIRRYRRKLGYLQNALARVKQERRENYRIKEVLIKKYGRQEIYGVIDRCREMR